MRELLMEIAKFLCIFFLAMLGILILPVLLILAILEDVFRGRWKLNLNIRERF